MKTINIELPYRPSPSQQLYHDLDTRIKLAVAAVRSGKSTSACIDMFEEICNKERYVNAPMVWLIIAPTYDLADEIMEDIVFKYIPQEIIEGVNRQKHEIKLITGVMERGRVRYDRILWRGADRPERLRVGEWDGAWLDEAEQFKPSVLDIVKTRVSNRLGTIWITTAPQKWYGAMELKRLSWIYEWLTDKGITVKPGCQVFPEHRLGVVNWPTEECPATDIDEIAFLRKDYGDTKAMQEFDGLYVDLYAKGLIKDEYFRVAEYPSVVDFTVVAIDPAASIKTLADYSCAHAWSIAGNNFYFKDELRGHFDTGDQPEMFYQFALDNNAHLIIVEDVAYQRSLISHIEKISDRIIVEGVPARGDKVARASTLAAIMKSGRCYFPPEFADDKSFIGEFTQFPQTKNDDRVDCTGYAIEYLDNYGADEDVVIRKTDRRRGSKFRTKRTEYRGF